jgi:hypothetical protein
VSPRETTTRRAYRAGFAAGSTADVGGTPLTAYRYPGLVKAYADGFADAQAMKRDLASREAPDEPTTVSRSC